MARTRAFFSLCAWNLKFDARLGQFFIDCIVEPHIPEPHEFALETHLAIPAMVGATRYIANPIGYPRDFRREPTYKPDRAIEVQAPATCKENGTMPSRSSDTINYR